MSPINQGGDDAVDSDFDATTNMTQQVTLNAGDDDLTIDAGLVGFVALSETIDTFV